MHNARACQTEEVKVSRRSLCESVPRVITIHFPYLIYHCRWKSTKSRWRGVINYRSARYRGACANAHKSLPFTRITTPIIFTRCYVHTRYIQKNFLSRKPSFESRRDEKNARIKFRGDKRLDGSKARKYPRNWLSIDFAESISNLYDHDAPLTIARRRYTRLNHVNRFFFTKTTPQSVQANIRATKPR